jgi:hypothetical protein
MAKRGGVPVMLLSTWSSCRFIRSGKRVSDGKVLSCRTRQVKHRAATALRMGANSLCRGEG